MTIDKPNAVVRLAENRLTIMLPRASDEMQVKFKDAVISHKGTLAFNFLDLEPASTYDLLMPTAMPDDFQIAVAKEAKEILEAAGYTVQWQSGEVSNDNG